jgi:hypothetical protein
LTQSSPIALFAFKRPVHLARTIEALCRNPEARQTHLFVFADAARDETDREHVAAVRSLVTRIDGFADVTLIFRAENYGLARNITSGISQVLEHYPYVIVVEDDILVSSQFLAYMNAALTLYRDDPRVASISGYCYPVEGKLPETFFIRGADCWGWATWRDRWALFRPDGQKLLNEIEARGLVHTFDFDGMMNCTQMLRDQIAKRNDSWAIRWHASCFLGDRLTLYPGRSLAKNIGTDGTGTHFNVDDTNYDVDLSETAVAVEHIPTEESQAARAAFRRYFRNYHSSEKRRSASPLARIRAAIGRLWR